MAYQPVTTHTATYAACVGTPGYLPMTVEGDFASIAAAWRYLADERERDLGDAPVEQDQTWTALSDLAASEPEPQCGSVYGPTPDGSEHDLGLVYEVIEEVEEYES